VAVASIIFLENCLRFAWIERIQDQDYIQEQEQEMVQTIFKNKNRKWTRLYSRTRAGNGPDYIKEHEQQLEVVHGRKVRGRNSPGKESKGAWCSDGMHWPHM